MISDRRLQMAALVVGGLLLLVLAFGVGVVVGARGFARPLPIAPFARPFDIGPGLARHGVIGAISAIEASTITINDSRSPQPQTIHFGPATIIERGRRQRIQPNQLRVGERIVVIGSPVDGMIQARFIVVLVGPTPPGLDRRLPAPAPDLAQ